MVEKRLSERLQGMIEGFKSNAIIKDERNKYWKVVNNILYISDTKDVYDPQNKTENAVCRFSKMMREDDLIVIFSCGLSAEIYRVLSLKNEVK